MEVCVVQLVAYSGGAWVRWRGVGARRVWVLREGGEGMWHEGEMEWWREQMGEMGWDGRQQLRDFAGWRSGSVCIVV